MIMMLSPPCTEALIVQELNGCGGGMPTLLFSTEPANYPGLEGAGQQQAGCSAYPILPTITMLPLQYSYEGLPSGLTFQAPFSGGAYQPALEPPASPEANMDEDNFPEDIHICGACQARFQRYSAFQRHKTECRLRRRPETDRYQLGTDRCQLETEAAKLLTDKFKKHSGAALASVLTSQQTSASVVASSLTSVGVVTTQPTTTASFVTSQPTTASFVTSQQTPADVTSAQTSTCVVTSQPTTPSLVTSQHTLTSVVTSAQTSAGVVTSLPSIPSYVTSQQTSAGHWATSKPRVSSKKVHPVIATDVLVGEEERQEMEEREEEEESLEIVSMEESTSFTFYVRSAARESPLPHSEGGGVEPEGSETPGSVHGIILSPPHQHQLLQQQQQHQLYQQPHQHQQQKQNRAQQASLNERSNVKYKSVKADDNKFLAKVNHCSFVGCLFTTKYKKDLSRHLKMHTGERPYPCPDCGKAFSRQDKMARHRLLHSGSKQYTCSLCPYRTYEKGHYVKHARTHTDERPYHCQMCPYKAKNSSQLTIHLRSHTGDAPFSCSALGCEAVFKTSSDLKRHNRIHTGEKPFQCDHCPHRVANRSNLRSHIRANHRHTEVFKCRSESCQFLTTSKMILREHHKTHVDSVKCGLCAFAAPSHEALMQHELVHKRLACQICDYTAKSSISLANHVNRRHGGGRTAANSDTDTVPATAAVANDKSDHKKPLFRPNFLCALCSAAFVRKDSLRSHLNQHKREGVKLPPRPMLETFLVENTAQRVREAKVVRIPAHPVDGMILGP